ncbi:alpha/beta fold hydrolase [Yoonia sp. R2-816]|uniref:alpha/beta fold hydrolase n=1 Tax=Yoonia sp. R2-816 TaxID=3342638 RepID=UPI003729EF6B
MNITTERGEFPCLDQGDGHPVLFVHGAASDHRTWSPVVKALGDRFRCVAPTLRWFGKHSWREDGPSFSEAAHAVDLVSILTTINAGPAYVVGWSYGANVALRVVAARPDLVSGVLIYEPSAPWLAPSPDDAAMLNEDALEVFAPVMAALSAGDTKRSVEHLVAASGAGRRFALLPHHLQAWALENAHTMPHLVGTKTSGDAEAPELANLAQLGVPISVAWGACSRPMWAVPSRAAAGCLNGNHREIAGADHLWPVSDPTSFADLVASCLTDDKLPSRAQSTP